jgi:hypothetical protein
MTIDVGHGRVAIVDAEDYERVAVRKWYGIARHCPGGPPLYYACSRGGTFLHRVILGAGRGQIVDHRNRDGLDCRRANLRFATTTQNAANRRPRPSAKGSAYKGVDVYRRGHYRLWRAQLCVEGRRYTAYRKTEREAAEAYNDLARQHFGDFAYLNEVAP